MAGHAFDLGIVEAIGRELVVRAHPFEHRRAAEDQIWSSAADAGATAQRKAASDARIMVFTGP